MERRHQRVVLHARLGFHAARNVDREGVGCRNPGGQVGGGQAAGEDERHLGATGGEQIPIEALTGSARRPQPVGVEKVVSDGRNPLLQVLPLSLDVAQPMSELPPSLKRP